MVISDKEAFRVLGLPLGVDKDAIRTRYKQLSSKLSSSKSPQDIKKLELIIDAYHKLLPPPPKQSNRSNQANQNKQSSQINNHELCLANNIENSNSENELEVPWRMDELVSYSDAWSETVDADKDRRKAEKRRARKKRRKEKKQLQKLSGMVTDDHSSADRGNCDDGDDDSNSMDLEGIDPESAFVVMLGRKMGSRCSFGSSERKSSLAKRGSLEDGEHSGIGKNSRLSALEVEVRQTQSRQIAIRGNEEANKGQYERAVRLFTEAIHLDPMEHRFFGNRSYCFDQLSLYEKALADAEHAIKLAPEWPKGHFRRGRALKGLGKYLEAEAAFEQVLRFDKDCEDVLQEITKVRKIRIIEMGFMEHQARAAIKKYNTVQPALDALLAGEFQDTLEDVFYSDDDDDEDDCIEEAPRSAALSVPQDDKMNPKNPDGLTSLWVGNVVPEVTEKMLIKVFNRYGKVTSVRQLKEKYCAFINYLDKTSAGNAMQALQGYELNGSKLLVKFPDNPIVNGTQNMVLRKPKVQNNKPVMQPQVQTSSTNQSQANGKMRGPVNGDECYFWRTTGCDFGDNCKYKHMKGHKGIDKKSWQK